MLSKKNFTIIGLTSFYNEFLRISIPGIAKLKQNVFLIIHNDNPNTEITKKQIRQLGYRGPLHIINTKTNVGHLKSRLNILSAIAEIKIQSDWMVFVDDDDIITNIDIPSVAPHNFAVLQNMAVIKKRLLDLFQIMDNPNQCAADNNHIVVERPHVGLAGTLVRTNIMLDLGLEIDVLLDKIHLIDDSLGYRPPVDMMMWAYLTTYARHINPIAAPIYMDRINYIATGLDSASHKYGLQILPPGNTAAYFESAMRRYNAVFKAALQSDCD